MRNRSTTAFAFLSLLVSCAHGHRANENTPVEPTTATLTITNDNWLDIEVYLLSGGTSIRLGDVTTSQSASFELPQNQVGRGSIRIRVHPVGSGRNYASPSISLSPGHNVVEMRVANVLNQSSVSYGVERD